MVRARKSGRAGPQAGQPISRSNKTTGRLQHVSSMKPFTNQLDLSAIREKLRGTQGRQFWRSLEEVADTPEFQTFLHREFPAQASELQGACNRRQFLKLAAASLALAGVTACTRQPIQAIVPYVR